jgi:hypothetical protein
MCHCLFLGVFYGRPKFVTTKLARKMFGAPRPRLLWALQDHTKFVSFAVGIAGYPLSIYQFGVVAVNRLLVIAALTSYQEPQGAARASTITELLWERFDNGWKWLLTATTTGTLSPTC